MIKDILKTTGIIAFFYLLGYAITYPYKVELANEDIVHIEDRKGEKFKRIEDIINYPDLKGKNLYIATLNLIDYNTAQRLNELKEKYPNVEFVYVYYSDVRSKRDIDHIRKWKKTLNKCDAKGFHLLGSYALMENHWEHDKRENKRYLPFAIFTSASGEIDAAPETYTEDEDAALRKLDSLLLNIKKNDTIISK